MCLCQSIIFVFLWCLGKPLFCSFITQLQHLAKSAIIWCQWLCRWISFKLSTGAYALTKPSRRINILHYQWANSSPIILFINDFCFNQILLSSKYIRAFHFSCFLWCYFFIQTNGMSDIKIFSFPKVERNMITWFIHIYSSNQIDTSTKTSIDKMHSK